MFAPRGKGRVIIGQFLGTGGFQALLLPARAQVRPRLFKISFWGELGDQVQVEVLIAKRLSIGGEPATNWFQVDPKTIARADISEQTLNYARHVRSRHTSDNKEVATLIEEDFRLSLTVDFSPKQRSVKRR